MSNSSTSTTHQYSSKPPRSFSRTFAAYFTSCTGEPTLTIVFTVTGLDSRFSPSK